jgi:hypothetical protein
VLTNKEWTKIRYIEIETFSTKVLILIEIMFRKVVIKTSFKQKKNTRFEIFIYWKNTLVKSTVNEIYKYMNLSLILKMKSIGIILFFSMILIFEDG